MSIILTKSEKSFDRVYQPLSMKRNKNDKQNKCGLSANCLYVLCLLLIIIFCSFLMASLHTTNKIGNLELR